MAVARRSAPTSSRVADAFIKLIKMLIAPIIFCTVVIGIAHVGDLKSVGRIGVKALIYFEVVTTFALLFGLLIGNIVKPGAGFNIDPQTLATGADAVAKKTGDGELPHTVEFLLNIIPDVDHLGVRREPAAAGALLRGAVRIGAGEVRRARAARRVRADRALQQPVLHDHRLDHEAGAAGRIRGDGLHHRPVRDLVAGQLRQADRRLLPRRGTVHPGARRRSPGSSQA